jgi:nitrogen fixation protein FixH
MKMAKTKNENSGLWVLMSFVSFFAIFIAVDIYFVYSAITTNTGLVSQNSYYKGLDYNNTLRQAEGQKQSGFTGKAEFNNRTLSFQLRDEYGRLVTNAQVKAYVKRQTTDQYDFEVALSRTVDGYAATLELPLKGLWQAYVEATWDNRQYKTSLTFTTY